MNILKKHGSLSRRLALATLATLMAIPAWGSTPTATATIDCDSIEIDASVTSLPLGVAFAWRLQITVVTSNGNLNIDTVRPFDAGGFSSYHEVFSIPITATGTIQGVSGTITQLENGVSCGPICGPTNIVFNTSNLPLTCGGGNGGGGGCPATIGYWKNEKKHPFPASVQTNGLSIGGTQYSKAQLYTILNGNGGNALAILGRQIVGALLNLAAGAKESPLANAALAAANALLDQYNLNLITDQVDPSSELGQSLIYLASILDAYNNGFFGTCTHGAGLTN